MVALVAGKVKVMEDDDDDDDEYESNGWWRMQIRWHGI